MYNPDETNCVYYIFLFNEKLSHKITSSTSYIWLSAIHIFKDVYSLNKCRCVIYGLICNFGA